MDLLSESLWHVPLLLCERELKYDGLRKKCTELFGKTMNSWRLELTCGAETLGKVPIKRGNFQGDGISLLLFVIALIPLTHISRTANPGWEFRTAETINHLLFIDDLKLYSRIEKALNSLIQIVRIFSKDIGMQFGSDICAVLVMKKGEIRSQMVFNCPVISN